MLCIGKQEHRVYNFQVAKSKISAARMKDCDREDQSRKNKLALESVVLTFGNLR